MRAALAPLLAAAIGCATPITSTLYDAPETGAIRKIAVLPLVDDPAAGVAATEGGAQVVTARLVEALSHETTLELIAPEEALRSGHGQPSPQDLQRDFAVEAVVTGTVRRYSEREGGPSGVTRPASVWFTLELRATDGRLLWSGMYREEQEALTENLFTLGLAWERGFRWVTAADLAAYGARELARALASDTASWS